LKRRGQNDENDKIKEIYAKDKRDIDASVEGKTGITLLKYILSEI